MADSGSDTLGDVSANANTGVAHKTGVLMNTFNDAATAFKTKAPLNFITLLLVFILIIIVGMVFLFIFLGLGNFGDTLYLTKKGKAMSRKKAWKDLLLQMLCFCLFSFMLALIGNQMAGLIGVLVAVVGTGIMFYAQRNLFANLRTATQAVPQTPCSQPI